jgi:hypothetical protein
VILKRATRAERASAATPGLESSPNTRAPIDFNQAAEIDNFTHDDPFYILRLFVGQTHLTLAPTKAAAADRGVRRFD